MKVSTKVKAGQPQQVTELTIHEDGMTPQDWKDLAIASLKIKVQTCWRKDGSIPATATVNAVLQGRYSCPAPDAGTGRDGAGCRWPG